MKKLYDIGILFIVAALFISCASNKSVSFEQRQPDENYLGNYDTYQLETAMCITKSMGQIRPCELALYCNPRTNEVEARFTYGVDKVRLTFTYAQRKALEEGIMSYSEAYLSGNLENRTPSKKNCFNRDKLNVGWGVFGYSRYADSYFRTNYEFLDVDKPYFVLTIEQAAEPGDPDVYSPLMNLYFSPTQLEQLLEIVDQSALEAHVAELNEKALAF